MKEEKLQTITNIFNQSEIRSVWDNEKEDYYFSVDDVILALTDSKRPRKYWNDLKIKLEEEASQLFDKIRQLKLKSKDGKYYFQDMLDTVVDDWVVEVSKPIKTGKGKEELVRDF